jgi:hypothetical protein
MDKELLPTVAKITEKSEDLKAAYGELQTQLECAANRRIADQQQQQHQQQQRQPQSQPQMRAISLEQLLMLAIMQDPQLLTELVLADDESPQSQFEVRSGNPALFSGGVINTPTPTGDVSYESSSPKP